jgi:hypothetical protein
LEGGKAVALRSFVGVVDKYCVLPSWRVAPRGGNTASERAFQLEVPRNLVMFEKLWDCLVAKWELMELREGTGLRPVALISREEPDGHLRRRHA